MENNKVENNFEQEQYYFANDKKLKKVKYKNAVLYVFTIVFLLSAIVLGVLYTNSNLQRNVYGNTLEVAYDRAVYDLVTNVGDIELNINKSVVSDAEGLQRKYLQLVCDNCKYAQSNLAQLPVNLSATREGVKFINQLDGYCTSLISSANKLTAEQKTKLNELSEIVVQLKGVLNNLANKILQGYSILDGSADVMQELDDFSANFEGFSSDSISYPSMIFDGPFSDSLYDKEIKGLSNNEVTQEDTYNKLESIISEKYNYSTIVYEGVTNANFETYDYTIKLNNEKNIVAQVAKRDGFLLSFVGESGVNEEENYTLAQCVEIAKNFCESCGVENMQKVWSETSYGVAVINLAPIINNVIYYPDLIKVKVDMGSGLVVGYEAQDYAYNNTTRTKTTPSLGATEARTLLDEKLNINEQKLCIMPLEYGGEVLAYEFNCEYYGAEYYVYINAFNGNEERVMKVVQTEEGDLLS